MAIRHIYDSEDEVPEEFRALYTARGGKWELTEVSGIKTVADVDRIQRSLEKERKVSKDLKTKLADWGDLSHDDVMAKIDRIDELELAAGGALDQAAIDKLVEKKVAATLKTHTAPLERKLEKIEKERDDVLNEVGTLRQGEIKRRREDILRPILTEHKVRPEHFDDAFLYAERHLTLSEEGQFVTKDGVGVTPGLAPKDWVEEFLPKRPGWLPGSVGGGAPGSRVAGVNGENPWAKDAWNMTKQSLFINQHGEAKAEQMARAAGVTLDAVEPAAK